MFRCPSCAKVYKIPLTNNHTILSSENIDRWWIVKEPIRMTSKFIEVKDLAETAEQFEKLGLDFIDDEKIPCPFCKVENTFADWNKAWEHPGEFFDGDNLCGCGGELWFDRVIGSNRFALACERCGWEKPKAVLSGAQGIL